MKILLDTLSPRYCLLLSRIIRVNHKMKIDNGTFNCLKLSIRNKRWKLWNIESNGDIDISKRIQYNPFSSSTINIIRDVNKVSCIGGILIEEHGERRRITYSRSGDNYESVHVLKRVTDDFYAGKVSIKPVNQPFNIHRGWRHNKKNISKIFALRIRSSSRAYLINAILDKNNTLTVSTEIGLHDYVHHIKYNIVTGDIKYDDVTDGRLPIGGDRILLESLKNIIRYLSKDNNVDSSVYEHVSQIRVRIFW